MKHINVLIKSLNKGWQWHKSHIDCFAKMLLGLVAVQTVSLPQISMGMPGKAQVSSRYQRLQRFFASFQLDFVVVARWLFRLFFAQLDRYYVLIDRTNWYWGKKKIHVFLLSIAYGGQAIPIFWTLLAGYQQKHNY